MYHFHLCDWEGPMLVVSQLCKEESTKPRPGKAKFEGCLFEGKLEFFTFFQALKIETDQETEWFST